MPDSTSVFQIDIKGGVAITYREEKFWSNGVFTIYSEMNKF